MSSDKNQKFSITKRVTSFGPAFSGLRVLFIEEHNSRIHVFVSLVYIVLGFYFKISGVEWILVMFSLGMLFVSELINTAIERMGDSVSPTHDHPEVGVAKDCAAASVLFSALLAALIGIIVFLPKILLMWK